MIICEILIPLTPTRRPAFQNPTIRHDLDLPSTLLPHYSDSTITSIAKVETLSNVAFLGKAQFYQHSKSLP